MNHKAMSAAWVFPVKFTLQFTSLAIVFLEPHEFEKEQAQPQQVNGKGKKAILESTVNSQAIGITLIK